MDNIEIQKYLQTAGVYNEDIDGKIGKKSLAAIIQFLSSNNIECTSWPKNRLLLAIEQWILKANNFYTGNIDGLIGEDTRYARSLWDASKNGNLKDVSTWRDNEVERPEWPKQSQVSNFYGEVGKNQVMLKLPYTMKVAWEQEKLITEFSVHEKVHDSALRCFTKIADAYNEEERSKLGIDLWGGCLNVRKMRGGSSWSMHAWGIAIDFDPDRNQLTWGKNRARLAKPDAELFWKIWEDEGWISLGREKNYDWMHVQAARV